MANEDRPEQEPPPPPWAVEVVPEVLELWDRDPETDEKSGAAEPDIISITSVPDRKKSGAAEPDVVSVESGPDSKKAEASNDTASIRSKARSGVDDGREQCLDTDGSLLVEAVDRDHVLKVFNGFLGYLEATKEYLCEICGEVHDDWPMEIYRTPWPPRDVLHWQPERQVPRQVVQNTDSNEPRLIPSDPDDCVAIDMIHDLEVSPGRKVAIVKHFCLYRGANLLNYVHKLPTLWNAHFSNVPSLEALRLFFLNTSTVNGELFTPRLTLDQFQDISLHFRQPIFWLARTLDDDKFGSISKYVSEPDPNGATFTSIVVTFNARNNPNAFPHLPLRCACSSEPAKNIQYALIDGFPREANEQIGRRIKDLSNHINHPLLTLMVCLELYVTDDLLDKRQVDQRLQQIERFTETGIPTFPKMQKKYILPETLDYYRLAWEFDKIDNRYIVVLKELAIAETDILFDHSKSLVRKWHPELDFKNIETIVHEDDEKRSRKSFDSKSSNVIYAKMEAIMREKWDELEFGPDKGRDPPAPGHLGRSDTNATKKNWFTRRKDTNTSKLDDDKASKSSLTKQKSPAQKSANQEATRTSVHSESDRKSSSSRFSSPERSPSRARFRTRATDLGNADRYEDTNENEGRATLTSKKYKDQASRLSTLAINLARLQSSIDFTMKLSRFLDAENKPHRAKPWKWNSAELVQSRIENAMRSIELLAENIRGLEKRATTQQSLLYSLISQADSSIGIRIAQSSEGIAADSKRDSSAMKTLAVLTMLFLPGTAVASIFSMDFFNWPNNGDGTVKTEFWIYWAVTVPLTFLCILAWQQWTKWRREDDEIARITRQEGNPRDAERAIGIWLSDNKRKRALARRLWEAWFRRNDSDRDRPLYGEVSYVRSLRSDRSVPVRRTNVAIGRLTGWLRKRRTNTSDDVETLTPHSRSPRPRSSLNASGSSIEPTRFPRD